MSTKIEEGQVDLQGISISKKSLFDLFKSHVIDPIFSNKEEEKQDFKNYADVLVINEDGKLLILLRSMSDSFGPGKWSLPGGKIESGENAIDAASRELDEETNIKTDSGDLDPFKTLSKKECNINYFVTSIHSSDFEIILDSEEHQGYEWIDLQDIPHKDFLLDLKDNLCDFFNIQSIIAEKHSEEDFSDVNDALKVTDLPLITKSEIIEKSFNDLNEALDQGTIDDDKYLEYYNKLKIIKSEYESSFENRVDAEGNDYKVRIVKAFGEFVKDENVLSNIFAERYMDFKLRMIDLLSLQFGDTLAMEAWGLRKGEDSEIDDLQSSFEYYVSDSFLYNGSLYDNYGYKIPANKEMIASMLLECPSIFVVSEDKLNPVFESNKPVVEGLPRKRFEQVLPVIQEYENIYSDLEDTARTQFADKQTDYITRANDMKKIIKSTFEGTPLNEHIFSLLKYIKKSLNQNLDPLLEVTYNPIEEGKKNVKQIYLSEFLEILTVDDQPDNYMGIIDLKVVDLDKFDEFDFNIEYFDPNDSILIQTICAQVNKKLSKKRYGLINLKKSFDDNLISEEEYIEKGKHYESILVHGNGHAKDHFRATLVNDQKEPVSNVDKNAWLADFKKYNLNKYPINIDREKVYVNLNGDIHSHAVLTWKDPKSGKQQDAYTQEFLNRNAEIKWQRISQLSSEMVDDIKQQSKRNLRSFNDKIAQSSAVINIIANTGLRVGSRYAFGQTGNKGVTTLAPDDITITGDKIDFNFLGKSYKQNESSIEDPELAQYLTKLQDEAKSSGSIFLFSVDRSSVDDIFKQVFNYKELKIKDLRTYIATSKATDILFSDLDNFKKTISEVGEKEKSKAIAQKLKSIYEEVSKTLNNTPAMAKSSYIHPNVVKGWLEALEIDKDRLLIK